MVVDPKRLIGKNGGLRRRRGTQGCCPLPPIIKEYEPYIPTYIVKVLNSLSLFVGLERR
jgi:hypothetical protein